MGLFCLFSPSTDRDLGLALFLFRLYWKQPLFPPSFAFSPMGLNGQGRKRRVFPITQDAPEEEERPSPPPPFRVFSRVGEEREGGGCVGRDAYTAQGGGNGWK